MFMVHVREGQRIRVGDQHLQVLDILQPGVVRLQVEGENEPFLISWDRKLEVLPDVRVTVNRTSPCYSLRIVLGFEAPRHIQIRELDLEDGG